MARRNTLQILATLRAAYPRQQLEPSTLELYAQLLDDLDPEALQRAAERHTLRSPWWPAIAELRAEVAAEATAELPDPALAWAEVLREVRRVGQYHAPTFKLEALADAVRAVGWESICRSERIGVDRARFVEAYQAARARCVQSAQLGGRAQVGDGDCVPMPRIGGRR